MFSSLMCINSKRNHEHIMKHLTREEQNVISFICRFFDMGNESMVVLDGDLCPNDKCHIAQQRYSKLMRSLQ